MNQIREVQTGVNSGMSRKDVVKALMISSEKCIGCKSCELICSWSKTNEFNPAHSAVKVIAFDEGRISMPVMCTQCIDAYCVKVCPVGATAKDENGTVFLDEKKCIGCKMCMSVCPLGNISYHSVKKKVIKCDLCEGDPNCAKICPSAAIQYKASDEANLTKKKKVAEKMRDMIGEADV